MATVNLGLVQGIKSSTTAPENDKLIWFDENNNVHKRYKDAVWGTFEIERASKVVNTDYTVTANDLCIIAQCTNANIEITLPDPTTFGVHSVIIRLGNPVYDSGNSKFYTIKVTGNIYGQDVSIYLINEYGAMPYKSILAGPHTPITGPKTWGIFLTESKTNNVGAYLTEAALNTALPVGIIGWYAWVVDTTSFWFWGGSAWVDSESSEDIDDTPRKGVVDVTEGENNIDFETPFTVIPQWHQVQGRDSNGNPFDIRIPPAQIRKNKFKAYATDAGKLHYEFNRV